MNQEQIRLQARMMRQKYRQKVDEFPAFLGNSTGTVDVPGRTGYSYIRTYHGDTLEAWRENIPKQYNMPVMVGMKGGRLTILGVRDVFPVPPTLPPIREHALSHVYPIPGSSRRTGYDWLPVHKRALTDLRVSSLFDGYKIKVNPGIVRFGLYFYQYDGIEELDLESYRPSSGLVGTSICYVVVLSVYLSGGVATLRVSLRDTPMSLINFNISNISGVPDGDLPLAAVKLYFGQVVIQENRLNSDIIDLRQWGTGAAGVDTFLSLGDVDPSTYVGYAGYNVVVNQDEDGLEFAVPCAADTATFFIDGALVTGSNVAYEHVITSAGQIQSVWIACKTPGTAGSTIVDVLLNGTSIFDTTPTNRPELAYDDADGIVQSGTPDTVDVAVGDVLTMSIIQVATGAATLSVIVPLNIVPGAINIISDVPNDGNKYIRKFGEWELYTAAGDPYELYSRIDDLPDQHDTGPDDEFENAFIEADWTQVKATGTITAEERRHVLSLRFSGMSTNDLAGYVRTITHSMSYDPAPSTRWYEYEAAIRGQSDAARFAMAGVLLTDGLLSTSKALAAVVWADDASPYSVRLRIYEGTLTNVSAVATMTPNLHSSRLSQYRVKLKITPDFGFSPTHYTINASMSDATGVQWTGAIGGTSYITWLPTYCGIAVSDFGSTGVNSQAAFDYFRTTVFQV